MSSSTPHRFRVGAVSYLNSLPLVHGMLHGPESAQCQVRFSLPSVCAELVEAGSVDIGLVPVAEIARQRLEMVPGVGIAACGAVRSILLISKCLPDQIRTLAADSSSRTSVQLARIILRERYGTTPQIIARDPDLSAMLTDADACLIIGDPALRIDPSTVPYLCLDLAEEWFQLTGLPFVFAAWAGKPGLSSSELSGLTTGSYRFGHGRIDEIAHAESSRRGISEELALRYLRHHLRFEIGLRELSGLEAFYELAGLNGVVHV